MTVLFTVRTSLSNGPTAPAPPAGCGRAETAPCWSVRPASWVCRMGLLPRGGTPVKANGAPAPPPALHRLAAAAIVRGRRSRRERRRRHARRPPHLLGAVAAGELWPVGAEAGAGQRA